MDDPAQLASVAAMMDDTRQEHGMNGQIASDPGRMGGQPCLVGTRITVQAIWELVNDGLADEDIRYLYPSVTGEHIAAVRALPCDYERRP